MRVALTIAGSDPSGGAGIQADLKTFHEFGVYGEAVISLLTVQNSRGIKQVELVAPDLVLAQLEAVLEDIPPCAAKTGALGSAKLIRELARSAERWSFPFVVDPLAAGKHGQPLGEDRALDAMRDALIPRAALVTPNIPEAEALTGIAIRGPEELRAAGEWLQRLGTRAVLIKGGHREGAATDVLLDGDGWMEFPAERIDTRHTHGTGCTLSAAITAGLAAGRPLRESIRCAKTYIQHAIRTAPGLGSGCGPLNHFRNERGQS
jgi:hydroxymethylpyrimidine/phosphomethylpyrimidine kinase